MKRGPSIAKILDTRNFKAVKLKFDVQAEQLIYAKLREMATPKVVVVSVKREEAALNPLDTWMP